MKPGWRGLAVSVALSAVGYLAFSLWGGWHEVTAAIARVGWMGTTVMLALSGLNYLIRFARWQVYLFSLGHRVAWKPSLVIYLSGFALTTTPGKAGEAVRSLFLKPQGVGYGESMAAFFSERLSDLLAIVLLATLGLSRYPSAWPLLLAGAVAVLGLLVLLSRETWLRRLGATSQLRAGRAARLVHGLSVLLIAARRCHTPRVLTIATVLSLAAWGAEALAFHMMLDWLGLQVDFAFAVFIYAAAMLAGALSFLPGGLGGAEATMVSLLLWAGQPQAPSVAATVLIRLTTLWFAVVLGLIALGGLLRQRPPASAEAPCESRECRRVTAATSWGRYPRAPAAFEIAWHDRHAALPVPGRGSLLSHGLGRSYGDVALNENGVLLRTRGLDRFIHFDRGTGILRAEAGVSLAEILELVVPLGWFLPVTPGTRFVTLGGAVANDVHGKNHHQAGTFGHHVTALELLRSDGTRLECRPRQSNADWFAATVGGLGLTGLIVWVEIRLARIARPFMWAVHRRFKHLDDYWALDAELGARHSHSVAWVDCLQGGRGIYSAADFVGQGPTPTTPRSSTRSMPVDPPFSLINGLSLRAFNFAYFHKPLPASGIQPALPFFYPLDSLLHWNRIYGRRGFFQYQCVLPPAAMREGATALFDRIARHGLGSFLAVFKTFGNHTPAGLLSFPRPGATLALDFPNQGARTLRLFEELDAIVRDAGGALYPAKDARMSAQMFQQSFPGLQEFASFVDPAFSSSFWRRVST